VEHHLDELFAIDEAREWDGGARAGMIRDEVESDKAEL
jgi:hypothetical protein